MPMTTRSRSRRGPRNTARRSKLAQRSRATSRSRMSSRLRKGKTNSLTTAIEKWWSRKAEVKMIYSNPYLYNTPATTLATGVSFPCAITAPYCYNLIPNIAQGNTATTRVGDYIQPRKLVFDFRASLLEPADVDHNFGTEIWPEDIMVHIFFVTHKNYKSNFAANTSSASGFASDISGALMGFNGIQASGFDGTVINSDKPVNTELFTVIKRMKFRLNRSSGFKSLVQLNGLAAPAPPTTVPLISVGGQDSKHFKVQIPLPKRLQFENSANTASNHFPFMLAGWTYTHSPLNQASSTLTPLSIQGNTQLYYTDD